MFINDLFRDGLPSKSPAGWLRTEIGDHVSIGSNATILPVRICSHTVIGAGSVVTRAISKPGIYAGNPARLIRDLSEVV
jgi:acetyltransferase-like isoleucine patch superfamily enzyme